MASPVHFETINSPLDSCSGYGTENHLDRLPPETLRAIFECVYSNDLLNLCLASRSFHELAAARLYRHISCVFSVLDNKVARESLDHFTAVLETIASSEYDYARFIRHVSLNRANMTDASHGELRGASSNSDHTTGKLLNTLMLIVLKRALGLESFKWDIRIELSSSILEVLSKMPSLQSLHVRFPVGSLPPSEGNSTLLTPSVPTVPPPPPGPLHIDITGIGPTGSEISHFHNTHHHHSSSHQLFPHQPGQPKLAPTSKTLGSSKTCCEKHSFSLFSGLRDLSVLDIDDLECIPELSQCLSSSSSSIRSLQLSISDRLALKARVKGPADLLESGSISETDDWGISTTDIPQPPPLAFGVPGPAGGPSSASPPNAQDAHRARVAQEAILGQIFGLEEAAHQQHLDQGLEETILSGDEKARLASKIPPGTDEDRNFVQTLRQMARILPAAIYGGPGSSRSQKTLDLIERATTSYLERMDKQNSHAEPHTSPASGADSHSPAAAANDFKIGPESHPLVISGSSTAAPHSASISQDAAPGTISTATETGNGPSDILSVSFVTAHNKTSDSLSDIVDLEHPDNIEDTGEDQGFLSDGDDAISNSHNVVTDNTPGVDGEYAQSEPGPLFNAKVPKGKETVRELKDGDIDNEASPEISDGQSLAEYVRSAHGMPLDSLSLHQIPVKATVLCRGVDAFALKHLSLLNVGPQRILWAMLRQLHQIRPLQLSSIHTDNITDSFLSFVNGLDRINEIFMFECSSTSKVKSFAPKTTVTIEDIKRQVLTKHIKSLRRLVIRNDEDSSWALNSRTARLVARHGSSLTELAVGLSASGYHHFLQEITGLRSLLALQIFYHHSDKCLTMLRELRSCVVDHILHFAHLRVEYVSMCYSAHRPVHNYAVHIMYPSRIGLDHHALKRSMTPYNLGAPEKKKLAIPSTAETSASNSSPEGCPSDDDNVIGEGGRPSMVIKGVRIRDIVGIKMWEKEIWSMKL